MFGKVGLRSSWTLVVLSPSNLVRSVSGEYAGVRLFVGVSVFSAVKADCLLVLLLFSNLPREYPHSFVIELEKDPLLGQSV